MREGVLARMRMWLAVAAVVLATQVRPAHADRDKESGAPLPPHPPERPSPIHDHFYAYGAFYSPVVHTSLRVDPTNAAPGVTGTPVNAERDLGLPGRLHMGRAEFMFRLRERSKLRVEYFESNRSGSQVLANDIVFGNTTFQAGELVQSLIDWRSFGLTYTYSFYRSERFEVGSGLGVFFLQADAIGSVPATGQTQEQSAAEPFPTLPLDLTWCISSRFAATARGNYLKASLNGISGSYTDLHGDVQYRWNPNFAVGAGWTKMRIALEHPSGNPPGNVSMSFAGPEVFLRFSF
jgi:hypothetical protein